MQKTTASDRGQEHTAPTEPDRTGPHPGDTDHPGQGPDEVQPDEGGDVDSPDPGLPGVQPDEGDVDFPGGVPEEQPSISPDPLTTLPPD